MNFEAMVIELAKSSRRLTRISLITLSCSRTLLRFGLSSMNPANCLDTAETFSSNISMAWPRAFTVASRTWALTSRRLICSLRLPSTLATLFASAKSCLNS